MLCDTGLLCNDLSVAWMFPQMGVPHLDIDLGCSILQTNKPLSLHTCYLLLKCSTSPNVTMIISCFILPFHMLFRFFISSLSDHVSASSVLFFFEVIVMLEFAALGG
jgi:hypothetical protein